MFSPRSVKTTLMVELVNNCELCHCDKCDYESGDKKEALNHMSSKREEIEMDTLFYVIEESSEEGSCVLK